MKKILLPLCSAYLALQGVVWAQGTASLPELPASMQAYLHLPPLKTLLAIDSRHPPQELQTAQTTVRHALTALLGENGNPEWAALLADQAGAVEAALMMDGELPLLAVNIGFTGAAKDFPAFADGLLHRAGGGAEDGMLELGDGKMLYFRRDTQEKRLQLLFTLGEQTQIRQRAATLPGNAAALQGVGEGDFFLRLKNHPALMPLLSSHISPTVFRQLQLDKIDQIIVDSGETHNALRLRVEMPPLGLRHFFPTAAAAADLDVFGTPQTVFGFTLPDEAQLREIDALLARLNGVQQGFYEQWQTLLAQKTGLSLSTLIAAVGGHWSIVSDDYGTIAAMPAERRAAWDNAAAMLEKAGILRLQKGREGIVHAVFTLPEDMRNKMFSHLKNPLQRSFLNAAVQNHYYWLDQGNYRLISDLPQPLLARAQKRAVNVQPLAEWLEKSGLSPEQAYSVYLLGDVDHLARKSYYSRLRWLRFLGDIGGTTPDLTALPAPTQLPLSARGHLGIGISGDERQWQLIVAGEHGASDWRHADHGISGISFFGILSAVTLPAYHDFVERSRRLRDESVKPKQ